jgi:hypothetical protein
MEVLQQAIRLQALGLVQLKSEVRLYRDEAAKN